MLYRLCFCITKIAFRRVICLQSCQKHCFNFRFSKVMNQVSVVMQLNLLKQTSDSSPYPSPLSLSSFQLVAPKSPSIAVGLAASGGGLGTDELNVEMPFHETSLNKLKPTLNFLLSCYAIDMVIVYFLAPNG